jgi:hypothetical protein
LTVPGITASNSTTSVVVNSDWPDS